MLKLTRIYFQEVSIPSDSQTKGSNNCNDTGILQKDVPLGKSTIMNDISEERTRHSAKSIEDPNEKPSTDDISLEKTSQKALSSCNAASLQAQELPKDGTETPKASLKACKLSAKPSETPCTKSPADYPSPNSEYAEMKILAPVAGDDQPGNHSWKKRTVSHFSLPIFLAYGAFGGWGWEGLDQLKCMVSIGGICCSICHLSGLSVLKLIKKGMGGVAC